jgi:hypothetical protein
MRFDNRTLPVLLFLLLGCAALALTLLTGAHKDAAFHVTGYTGNSPSCMSLPV